MKTMNRQALSVFIFALLIRVVGAVVTTITSLNPESRADATRFESGAAAIARGLSEGQPFLYTTNNIEISQILYPLAGSDTILMWGAFMSPFWLLPGPSGLYARLGNGLLGAIAIYQVYCIARYYYSHQTALIIVLPMAVYPSFVAVQTTLLRDVFVFFGITTAARLLIIPTEHWNKWISYLLAYGVLHLILLHRGANFVLYAGAIATAVVVHVVRSRDIHKEIISFAAVCGPIVYILSGPIIEYGIERLARTRRLRASGRAVYLPDLIPQTLSELLQFSWVGASYFLYAPFPWMIETIPDVIVSLEGICSMVFTIGAIWGVRSLGRKNAPVTIGLLVGFVLAAVFYGVGTVNYGTGMRHRQMILWVIFLFGGIGITEHVRFIWPFRDPSGSSEDVPPNTPSQSD